MPLKGDLMFLFVRFFLCLLPFSSILAYSLDDSFDAYVQQVMKEWEIPGMALGVIKDGQVIKLKGYGIKDIHTQEPVDEHTLFPLASVTKSFTSTLLAMLVEEKKINWDDPLIKYLPDFELSDSFLARETTIKDVACHRLSIESGAYLWYLSSYNQREIYRKLKFFELKGSPRTRFNYSNVGYLILGLLSQSVTGRTWGELVKEKILHPLHMRSSLTHLGQLPLQNNIATSHIFCKDHLETRKWLDFENCAPAIAMSSNVVDLLKWVSFHLKHDAGFLKEMHSPQMLITDEYWTSFFPDSICLTYGFGLFVHDYKGRKVLQHAGCSEGANAAIAMVPEEGLGIVVLINRDVWGYFAQAICYKLYDTFYHTTSRNTSEEFLSKYHVKRSMCTNSETQSLESKEKHTPPSLNLQQYCGTYHHPLYDQIVIHIEEDTLCVSSLSFNGFLRHFHSDTFVLVSSAPSIEQLFIEFSIDKEKNVSGMLIKIPDNAYFSKQTS